MTKNATAGVEKTGFASEFLIVNLNCFAYLWPHSYTHRRQTNVHGGWVIYSGFAFALFMHVPVPQLILLVVLYPTR